MLDLIKLESKKSGGLVAIGISLGVITFIFGRGMQPYSYINVLGSCIFLGTSISMECFTKLYCKEYMENSLKISMVSPYGKKNVLKAKIIVSIIKFIPMILGGMLAIFLVSPTNFSESIIMSVTEIIFTISLILLMIYWIIRTRPKVRNSVVYDIVSFIISIVIKQVVKLGVSYNVIIFITVIMALLSIYLYIKNFNKIAIDQELY